MQPAQGNRKERRQHLQWCAAGEIDRNGQDGGQQQVEWQADDACNSSNWGSEHDWQHEDGWKVQDEWGGNKSYNDYKEGEDASNSSHWVRESGWQSQERWKVQDESSDSKRNQDHKHERLNQVSNWGHVSGSQHSDGWYGEYEGNGANRKEKRKAFQWQEWNERDWDAGKHAKTCGTQAYNAGALSPCFQDDVGSAKQKVSLNELHNFRQACAFFARCGSLQVIIESITRQLFIAEASRVPYYRKMFQVILCHIFNISDVHTIAFGTGEQSSSNYERNAEALWILCSPGRQERSPSKAIVDLIVGSCTGPDLNFDDVLGTYVQSPLVSASLNDSQLHGVVQAQRKRFSLIQGPPGTGKTNVAAEILMQWLLARDGCDRMQQRTILAAAFTNAASQLVAKT